MSELIFEHSVVSPNGHICKVCGKEIRHNKIGRHLRAIHSPDGTSFRCPKCDVLYPNRARFYNHLRRMHPEWKGVNTNDFIVQSAEQGY